MRSVVLAALALIVGCYDVPTPVCGFSCAKEGECPDGYTCSAFRTGGDGFCHLNGFDETTCPGHDASDFDVTSPFVQSVTPDQNLPLPPTSPIIVRFSEKVTGVTSSSLFVSTSTGEKLLATVTNLDVVNWELTTFAGFPLDQTFTLTLTKDIKDIAGNPLFPSSFTFFTQSPQPPQLQSTSPNNQATNVNVGTNIQVIFNKPAVNVGAKFHLADAFGNPIQTEILGGLSTMSPIWIIRWQLTPQTTYVATIDAGLTDGTLSTSSPSMFSFTTGIDNLGPRIWSRIPGFDITNVPVITTLELDFDEDAMFVDASSVLLETASGVSVPASVTYDAASRIAILRPDSQLAPFTEYDASITSTIQDNFGNSSQPDIWSFMTGADDFPPEIRSTTPATGSVGAPLTTAIVMNFDEPAAGLSTSNLFVTAEPSTAITGTLVASNNTHTWTFTPSAPLPPFTVIDVDVGFVRDTTGNSTSYFFSFTTGP